MYQDEARAILFLFLERLEKQEKKEFLLLSNQWGVIRKELESLILKLAEKEIKTEDQLYRLALYQQFLEESKVQIGKYSNIASGIVSEGQKFSGNLGIESTQEILSLQVKLFQKLPKDVINNFIGKSFYDGAKLNETLFAKSYPDYISKVKETLLKSIALGRNPRDTARLIRNESNAPLWQSLRLARTEQLSIFRETSLLQMKESGVVSGWERIEQSDCCSTCEPLNGKRYKFDEDYDDFHPNCRGSLLPIIEV